MCEDSRPGVLAAKAAGMACVALPAPGSEDAPEFHRADFMIPGGAGAFDPSDALDWLASLRREAPSLGTRA